MTEISYSGSLRFYHVLAAETINVDNTVASYLGDGCY